MMSVSGLDTRAATNSAALPGLDGRITMNSNDLAAVKSTVGSNMASIGAL